MSKNTAPILLTEGNLLKRILGFALPVMLTSMLQMFLTTMDNVVIGQFCGSDDLGAMGCAIPIVSLIVNILLGISTGTAVCIAQSIGSRNSRDTYETVHTSMAVALICGVFFGIAGFAISKQALVWMDCPTEMLDGATIYLRIYFIGMPFAMFYNFGAAILRAVGDTKRPLIFLIIAGIVNVLLNLLTVIAFRMGVAGVALATSASQGVSAALVVIYLMKREDACRLVLRHLHIYPDKLMSIVRVGLPAGLQGAVFSISNVLIQSSVNSFGSLAMEGNTAAGNLEGFIYNTMNAFYHAALTFTGQNLGARKPHRILRILFTCIALSVSISLLLSSGMYLLREPLLALYRPDSPEALAYGSLRMSIIVLTYFLCGIMDIFTGSLRGMGASLTPMLISLIGACATRVVWIYTVFAATPTLEILYLCYPVSWLFTICMQIVAFIVMRRKALKRYGTPLEIT